LEKDYDFLLSKIDFLNLMIQFQERLIFCCGQYIFEI